MAGVGDPVKRWAAGGFTRFANRAEAERGHAGALNPKDPKNLAVAKATGKCSVCGKSLNGAEKSTGLCGQHA